MAVDRELAAKLQKRLASLDMTSDDDFSSQVLSKIPSAPPAPILPPPLAQDSHPGHPTPYSPNDQVVDIDKLIGDTIRNSSAQVPRQQGNEGTTTGWSPPKKPSPSIANWRDRQRSESAETDDSAPLVKDLATKCAPVIPIVHRKCSMEQKHLPVQKPSDSSDALEKERRELEEKLAKQRQKKMMACPQPDILQGLDLKPEEVGPSSGTNNQTSRSGSIPSNGLVAYGSREDHHDQQSPLVSPTCKIPPAAPKKPKCPALMNTSSNQFLPISSPIPLSSQPLSSQPLSSQPLSSQPLSSPCSSSTSNRTTSTTGTAGSGSADESDELAAKLARRNMIVEGEAVEPAKAPKLSVYTEFHEFSRKQIKYFMETFKRFDEDGDSFIDFNELKLMMEKLGEAQTHIALKGILKMVDEDGDGKVSLREFLLIFRYAATGQLSCSEVFNELAQSVDVTKEGVQGAAGFFQAKIDELKKSSKFEEEIKQEQEERRRMEEEKKERKQSFLANKAVFSN